VRLRSVRSASQEFTEFYETSRDACLRVVVVSVGDSQTAEDLVAEAFTRAWARWSKVREHPAPQAWVVRTALNASVSRWRGRRREVALGSHDEPFLPASDSIDAGVASALQRLPKRQREVIALRVFLDLDTQSTAVVLGIAAGTVTAHLSRAIAALRDQLTPLYTTEVER